jgi:hypothetical protein
MNRIACAGAFAVTALIACSSLPRSDNGVVALEVRAPDTLALVNGASLTLHARALDINGDSVAADVRWRTPDTALVTLDSLLGVVTARSDTGTARVQASVGTLLSDVILIPLHPVPTMTGQARSRP